MIESGKTKNGHSSQRNARNEHASKRRLTATRTSPEVLRKWRGRESSPGSGPRDSPSRLLLQSVAFTSLRWCPLQWRGRTGVKPVSVAPVRDQLLGEAIYVSAPAQAPESSRRRSTPLARPYNADRSSALTEEAGEGLSPPPSSWACPKRGSGGSCARRQ
jgi:hypothetical protein